MEIPEIRTAANIEEVGFIGSSPSVSVLPDKYLSKKETIFVRGKLPPSRLSENRFSLETDPLEGPRREIGRGLQSKKAL
jgi:hypothetical protein